MNDEPVVVVLDCPDCGHYEETGYPGSSFAGRTFSVPCRECGKMIEPEIEEERDAGSGE